MENKKPEFEEVSTIAAKAISLLNKQRYHNSDAVSPTQALTELQNINEEVKRLYGSFPEGWNTFYMRANTLLELSERHRGDGRWESRLDNVYSRVVEARDLMFAAETQRVSQQVAAAEGRALLVNREASKKNARLYRDAKAQAAKTGASIQFTD